MLSHKAKIQINDEVADNILALLDMGWAEQSIGERLFRWRKDLAYTNVRRFLRGGWLPFGMEKSILQETQHMLLEEAPPQPIHTPRVFVKRKDSTKKLALERDGSQCVYCGSKERLEVSHQVPIRFGGKDVLSNVETLCHKHHARYEVAWRRTMRSDLATALVLNEKDEDSKSCVLIYPRFIDKLPMLPQADRDSVTYFNRPYTGTSSPFMQIVYEFHGRFFGRFITAHYSVECSYCHAPVGEPCRYPSGKLRLPSHSYRRAWGGSYLRQPEMDKVRWIG